MIYDTLAHIQAYQGIHPGVYRGLELLRDTDFSRLEDRRYEVDGEDLYFFFNPMTASQSMIRRKPTASISIFSS